MKRQYVLFLALLTIGLVKLTAQPIQDWMAYYEPGHINDWAEDEQHFYLATDVGIYLLDKTTGCADSVAKGCTSRGA